jgi:hypothetical protein
MTNHQQPGPIDWANYPKTREAWIQAHLRPGERLEDFLPPRPPVDRHAAAAAIVRRRAKVRPAWKGLLWAVAGLTLWPLLAFAFSWFVLALLLGWLAWCFWPSPRAPRWKAPRELPPWPGDLAAASWRRRRGEPREGDLYAP